jgi:hypothetical protein
MKFCRQTQLLEQPRVHEISTSHFGTRMAHPAFDGRGSLAFFRIGVDAALFEQKLGKNAIASIMDGLFWYDIELRSGLYTAHSKQSRKSLTAAEIRCDKTAAASNSIRIWCEERELATEDLPRGLEHLIPTEMPTLGFLAQSFSKAFRAVVGEPPAAIHQHASNEKRPKQQRPFIVTPESSRFIDPNFSPSMVVLQ